MTTDNESTPDHPFVSHPHKTLLMMSIPLLISLIAEPLTGLVDTAFIARLGAAPLAAVGIGTTALSSLFWVFNFLSIGTQTRIAQALGKNQSHTVQQTAGMVTALGLGLGLVLILLIWPFAGRMVELMGGDGQMHSLGVSYVRIRVLGAPAVLLTFAVFGVMRGMQDMKTQLKIALIINLLNILLDPVLIFGLGPFPALGVAGAAWASILSQWAGAVWGINLLSKTVGISWAFKAAQVAELLQVGRDLFIRTGLINVFLLMTTRYATLAGPETGAAHQALRQFWVFSVFFLDAYAIAGQSLVGYFYGMNQKERVMKVARIVCLSSLAMGCVLSLAMVTGQEVVAYFLVPDAAVSVFASAWLVVAVFQPLNALAFGTDGIHWGMGDFRYLRQVMVLASVLGLAGLYIWGQSLAGIWAVTGIWVAVRSVMGILRVWPGMGNAPVKHMAAPAMGRDGKMS